MPDVWLMALFYGASEDFEIKNITFNNISINANNAVGSIVGIIIEADESSIIENIVVNGEIAGRFDVGGITGESFGSYCNISGIHMNADLRGYSDVGGIIGLTGSDTLSLDNILVTGDIEGSDSIGGLIGWSNDGWSITKVKHT